MPSLTSSPFHAIHFPSPTPHPKAAKIPNTHVTWAAPGYPRPLLVLSAPGAPASETAAGGSVKRVNMAVRNILMPRLKEAGPTGSIGQMPCTRTDGGGDVGRIFGVGMHTG
jgi:hypothetical protein